MTRPKNWTIEVHETRDGRFRARAAAGGVTAYGADSSNLLDAASFAIAACEAARRSRQASHAPEVTPADEHRTSTPPAPRRSVGSST